MSWRQAAPGQGKIGPRNASLILKTWRKPSLSSLKFFMFDTQYLQDFELRK